MIISDLIEELHVLKQLIGDVPVVVASEFNLLSIQSIKSLKSSFVVIYTPYEEPSVYEELHCQIDEEVDHE